MREQVCVTKQRPCGRFSVVTYALAAFRYLATGIVALLLATARSAQPSACIVVRF